MSEAQISLLFDEARAELSKINKQAHGAKKRIIKDLADKLETGKLLPKDAIAEEIKHQLKGHVSASLVDKVLGIEYKNEERSESGRKGAETKKNSKNIPANSEAEKPLVKVTEGGAEEVTISNSPKVVSDSYSPGAKPDRTATYTEKQAFKIRELESLCSQKDRTIIDLQDKLKHADRSGYAEDNTQELLEAQAKIKELEAEVEKLRLPFDAPTTIDFAGKRLKGASAHVRPANREVPIVTVPEAVIPAGAF